MIFRTEEAKKDLIRSWNRPDRPFFAAGACHILAAAFLETYPNTGFQSLLIAPRAGMRGSHVVVSNGRMVFDYHGYIAHDVYFSHYFTKIRRFIPQWRGDLVLLEESPISESFCRKHHHRFPDQYPCNPIPRGLAYVNRFRPPMSQEADPSTSSG